MCRAVSRSIFFAVLIALLFEIPGCGRNRKADIATGCPDMQEYDPSLASRDASRAVQQGNKKLFGIYGYATFIPGIIDKDAARRKYGLLVIKGTTDAIANATCGELNDKAIAYATAYNKTVTELIR